MTATMPNGTHHGAVPARNGTSVKAAVNGMPDGNTDALANPEALDLFRNISALAQ